MACCDKTRTISMTRGTTYRIAVKIKSNGEPYQLLKNEILRFGVKKHVEDSYYLIRRDVRSTDFDKDEECYYITIFPEDTECLALGTYTFDIGIQPDEINYYNIFAPAPFVLSANITGREDYENI